MSQGLVGASARLGAIVFVTSACSGTPGGGGNIALGGGTGGSTDSSTSVTYVGGSNTAGSTSTTLVGGNSGYGAGGTSATQIGGSSSAGTKILGAAIVPLYSYPTEAPWSAIVTAKLAHPSVPVIAIANVNDGPGTSVDSEFTSGIHSLTTAGIVVIGYVYTSYGAREAATVKAEIDAWHKFYPGVTGLFFDEESNADKGDAYYRDLAAYAKSAGMTLTVANPGTDTSLAYINAVDVTFIYESAGIPSNQLLATWRSSYTRSKVGVIPYAAGFDLAWMQLARSCVGYIYVTNDDLPNPWDTLPSYFPSLLAALE
jgi:hypothetical protein